MKWFNKLPAWSQWTIFFAMLAGDLFFAYLILELFVF